MHYPHIAARALNRPLLLEPGYARHFFAALGPRMQMSALTDAQGHTTPAAGLPAQASAWEGDERPRGKTYRVHQGIAILPVAGTLVHKSGYIGSSSGVMGYDGIASQLQDALADPTIKGILLDIDSPGGEVSGVQALATQLAASTKPVWAHANEMAASAAYWLASTATRLVLTETAEVGSIGVLMAHADHSQALATEGIAVTLIYSGAHKVDGNPYAALPATVLAEYQQDLDALRTTFATAVATGRRLSVDQVMATEARLYRGAAAVQIGLADGIASFDDTLKSFSTTLAKPGVIYKGKSMSKPDNNASPQGEGTHPEQSAQATAQARSEALAQGLAQGIAQGTREGTAAERQRIAAILTHANAAGREATARALALETDMTADAAIAVLASVPLMGAATKAAQALAQMGDLPVVRSEADSNTPQTLAQRNAAARR